MIVIGLTGSIGMGKSTAAKMLKLLGVPVHDSDKAVHDALKKGGAAYSAVLSRFPSVGGQDGIDRKKLGATVFSDKDALKNLENILHPIAQEKQYEFLRTVQAKGKSIAVLEIPLLFETGADARVDFVISVSAPAEIQKRRVMKRSNMTEEKFHSILDSQMPDAQKRALSDYVVDTGLGPARTFRQLQKIIREVRTKPHA